MQKLIAQRDILFEGRIYSPEEELPTKDSTMVEAWLAAGTAVWIEDEQNHVPKTKARSATAEPGQPGVAAVTESEDGDNLIGKVPKTTSRKKIKK